MQLTSALTSTIGSNGVKIFLLIFSAIIAGVTDVISWIGISLVVLFIGVYGYLCVSGKQHPPKPAAERVEGGNGTDPKASEKTPLRAP